MKLKPTLLSLCGIVMLTSVAPKLHAQVTIGNTEAPAEGALLQIKNIENITNGNANATKGMALPRVTLTSNSNLFPMFVPEISGGVIVGYDGAVKEDEDKLHVGLAVYHVSIEVDQCHRMPSGIHIWDGHIWNRLGAIEQEKDIPDIRYITDHQGNRYRTRSFGVAAGRWMVENLRTTALPNGTAIPFSKDTDVSIQSPALYNIQRILYPHTILNGETPPLSWYPAQGLLYSYAAATAGVYDGSITNVPNNPAEQLIQGVCPNGWHLPTDFEWRILEEELATNPQLYSDISTPRIWNSNHPQLSTDYRPTEAEFNAAGQSEGHAQVMLSPCLVEGIGNDLPGGKSFSAAQGGFASLAIGWGNEGTHFAAGLFSPYWASTPVHISSAYHRRIDTKMRGLLARGVGSRHHLLQVRCKEN